MSDHRLWTTSECSTHCSFWDCTTFCFPDPRTITNRVFNVHSSGTDKYHFCGFYER
jgi:hypothetical protein